jgi:murein DD-endopeptidase
VSHRDAFLQAVESLIGMPVCWSHKGDDAYDCSGVVTACYRKVGGEDLRFTVNSQGLHDRTRLLVPGRDLMLPGDLVFYGLDSGHVEHVAVYDEYGGVISADGATSHILDLRVAMANPANRVRRHASIDFRKDLPWRAVHRNTLVDKLDNVTR